MHRTRKLQVAIFILLIATLACSTNTEWLFKIPTNTPEEIASTVTPAPSPTSEAVQAIHPLVDIESALMAVYEEVSPGIVSILVLNEQGMVGSGSGFVIDLDGHIVTNLHVVQNPEEIQVSFPSGLKVRAELIGTDKDSDLAVLHVIVEEKYLHPLSMGDSDLLNVGQIVVAIGSPFGLNGTMTYGIISNIGRTNDSLNNNSSTGRAFSTGELIQTDAAINPGNSGGPLVNLAGEVVGINRSIQTFNTNTENEPVNSGIGFAISVNILNTVIDDLIEFGKYDYPYLGIGSIDDLPLTLAEELGLELAIGVYITNITDKGPANIAGIKVGDVINQINDEEVRNFGDLLSYLFIHTKPGDTVDMHIFRDGEIIIIPFEIGTRP